MSDTGTTTGSQDGNLGAKLIARDKAALATRIGEATDGAFDGDVAIIPLSDDAPAEAPRLVLKSRDGTRTCILGLQRLDLVFSRAQDPGSEVVLPDSRLVQMMISLRDTIGPAAADSFQRAAVITNWIVELQGRGKDLVVSRGLWKMKMAYPPGDLNQRARLQAGPGGIRREEAYHEAEPAA